MKTKRAETGQFFRGQTVTIAYDEKFAAEYPHTAKLFDGKTGVVRNLVDNHGLMEVKIPFMKITTMVDPRFLF